MSIFDIREIAATILRIFVDDESTLSKMRIVTTSWFCIVNDIIDHKCKTTPTAILSAIVGTHRKNGLSYMYLYNKSNRLERCRLLTRPTIYGHIGLLQFSVGVETRAEKYWDSNRVLIKSDNPTTINENMLNGMFMNSCLSHNPNVLKYVRTLDDSEKSARIYRIMMNNLAKNTNNVNPIFDIVLDEFISMLKKTAAFECRIATFIEICAKALFPATSIIKKLLQYADHVFVPATVSQLLQTYNHLDECTQTLLVEYRDKYVLYLCGLLQDAASIFDATNYIELIIAHDPNYVRTLTQLAYATKNKYVRDAIDNQLQPIMDLYSEGTEQYEDANEEFVDM